VRGRLVEGLPLDVGQRSSAPVLGIEHEYRVLDGDVQLDFAPLLHTLEVDGLRLDPTDPNAYRTPWGGLVTSDGREAEVAIAPVALRPGCTSELEWRTLVARDALASALPSHLRLDGYSTHLNLEVDDDDVVAAGRFFVKRFAPAMMLMLDRPTSPGLLVRPRSGRLELGGEYCQGDQLRAAATFAAAGGLACAAAVRSRDARRRLPRAVRARVRPSNIRAGWYVDRRAFGTDLYRDGRSARLRYGVGRSWTAQAHLHETWDRARPMVEPLLDDSELGLVDRVIDGTIALPLEGGPTSTGDSRGAHRDNAFGEVVRPRVRPGYRVEPASIAWDAVVFDLHGARDGIVCIPRPALPEFLADLDAGRLDEQIGGFLASPPQGRVLRASDQTGGPGLFDEMASPSAIVPPERVPGRGVLGRAGGGTPADARRNKSRRTPRPRRFLVAGGVIVAVVAAGAVALAARGGDEQKATVAAVAPSSSSTTTTVLLPFSGTFVTTFTVTAVNAGPSLSGDIPQVGDVTTSTAVVDCDLTTCTITSPETRFDKGFLQIDLIYTLDHFEGSRVDPAALNPCPELGDSQLSTTIDLVRDATGKVVRFTGTNVIFHPSGVEATAAGGGQCATEDLTTTFVGVPA
jgi:hypothetical protein